MARRACPCKPGSPMFHRPADSLHQIIDGGRFAISLCIQSLASGSKPPCLRAAKDTACSAASICPSAARRDHGADEQHRRFVGRDSGSKAGPRQGRGKLRLLAGTERRAARLHILPRAVGQSRQSGRVRQSSRRLAAMVCGLRRCQAQWTPSRPDRRSPAPGSAPSSCAVAMITPP